MSKSFKLTGARELDQALGELKKSSERSILRRAAIKALEPIRDRAKELVPVNEGTLRASIVIGTTLTRSAKKDERAEPKGGVRMFVGTADRIAVAIEFGTYKARARPYMRPAFDSAGPKVFGILEKEIGAAITRAAARAAKSKG